MITFNDIKMDGVVNPPVGAILESTFDNLVLNAWKKGMTDAYTSIHKELCRIKRDEETVEPGEIQHIILVARNNRTKI